MFEVIGFLVVLAASALMGVWGMGMFVLGIYFRELGLWLLGAIGIACCVAATVKLLTENVTLTVGG